jgi:hypothetical protein
MSVVRVSQPAHLVSRRRIGGRRASRQVTTLRDQLIGTIDARVDIQRLFPHRGPRREAWAAPSTLLRLRVCEKAGTPRPWRERAGGLVWIDSVG